MTDFNLQSFEKLSPFEIKDELIKLARKSSQKTQSAFLNAYRLQFPRLLDVEKWWAVILVHFTGLDPTQAWSLPVTLQKLEEALQPPPPKRLRALRWLTSVIALVLSLVTPQS